MDLKMPVMDGMAASRRSRALPDSQVILMSSFC
jgi:CheY-like chemotaxis protein